MFFTESYWNMFSKEKMNKFHNVNSVILSSVRNFWWSTISLSVVYGIT